MTIEIARKRERQKTNLAQGDRQIYELFFRLSEQEFTARRIHVLRAFTRGDSSTERLLGARGRRRSSVAGLKSDSDLRHATSGCKIAQRRRASTALPPSGQHILEQRRLARRRARVHLMSSIARESRRRHAPPHRLHRHRCSGFRRAFFPSLCRCLCIILFDPLHRPSRSTLTVPSDRPLTNRSIGSRLSGYVAMKTVSSGFSSHTNKNYEINLGRTFVSPAALSNLLLNKILTYHSILRLKLLKNRGYLMW